MGRGGGRSGWPVLGLWLPIFLPIANCQSCDRDRRVESLGAIVDNGSKGSQKCEALKTTSTLENSGLSLAESAVSNGKGPNFDA